MNKVYDHIVIGAGAAGMAISCLLKRQNSNHLVLEAHHYLGGSASYFFRNGYCFDVGATTLSGIKNNGPLKNFLDKTQIELPLIAIDPGIISVINQKQIEFSSNLATTITDIQSHFPNISKVLISKFLTKLDHLNSLAYQAIANNQLPIRNNSQLLSLLKTNNLNYIQLLPLLSKSFYDFLPDEIKKEPDLLKIIDEILFITAQNNSINTPALFGILGLMYPTDTYYLNGGMKTLFDILKENAGEIKINQQVLSIAKKNNLFYIQTNRDVFITKKIISTLPQKNNLNLLDRPQISSNETWSAFTLYFTVPESIETKSLYYQIHGDTIPLSNTNSFFVSFSHPNDLQRNKNKRRTVSISTHIMPKVFNHLDKENYQKNKLIISDFILNKFCETFNITPSQIQNLESGTSKTFEYYTHRYQGSVGGYGHHLNQNLLKKIYHSEIEDNFYSIGDTTFPGQGIAAVIYGAMSLESFLYR